MKLYKQSEKVLKYKIKEYHKSGQKIFLFEDLKKVFYDFSEEQLDTAL